MSNHFDLALVHVQRQEVRPAAALDAEEAKIRIVNASHSAIAWAGALAGHTFIHQGVGDARIRRIVHDYVSDDAIPCLRPSPINLDAYRDSVLDRFGNAALGDTTQRVAADGFAKLPGFIAPTLHERLAGGQSIASVAVLPALLLAFVRRWQRGELPFEHHDQALDAAAARALCAGDDPLAAFCSSPPLWGALAGDPRLMDAVALAGRRVSAEFG